MKELIEKIKKAHFIWICGNGGSASTAEHFTTDLIKRGYPAICLNSNISVITMIANDYGYDEIFAKQLLALGDDPDLLITISCSGTSGNITRVIEASGEMNKYQFETFQDGDVNYGLLEDKHLAFVHQICKLL